MVIKGQFGLLTSTVGISNIAAGSNIIGKVGIDQTTPGTTNNVYVTTIKPDGSNTMPSLDVAARKGFFRHTDGTNVTPAGDASARPIFTDLIDGASRDLGKVDIAAELPAGTQLIGKVGIDQTTPGTTNAVDVTDRAARDCGKIDIAAELPAGTQNIGDVDVASIAAGSNLIGKVSIDQVTANANEVVVKSITAGANTIGRVRVVDHADAEIAVAPGEAFTHALVVAPCTYVADPTAATASRSYTSYTNRNRIQVAFDAEAHYMAEGFAYVCLTPSVTCTTETKVFGMSAQTTRIPIITYISVTADAPALIQLYIKPTGAFSGTAITASNRHPFVADAANALTKHTCAFATTNGVLVWSRWIDATTEAVIPKGYWMTGYNGPILLITGTATGVVASANVRVNCWWYEVSVA